MPHVLTLGLLGLVALARIAGAADAVDPARDTYVRYCGACHGPGGHGDGIAGSFMTPKPKDLTKIATENGGTFPFTQTMARIDGTNEVRAHGDPDMPVWGEVFRQRAGGDATRAAEVRGKLMLITQYLQSIQAK